MITCSTLSGKAVCRLVWDMNKAGFFTPPYETASGLKARLAGMYADVDMGNLKSMAWFVCRKAG